MLESEATFLLGVLAIRSKRAVPDLPVTGDGSSGSAASCEAIENVDWARNESILTASESFQNLPASAVSRFTWRLRSSGDDGTLYITHRYAAGPDAMPAQVYPDLSVSVRRVHSARADDMGYWLVMGLGLGLGVADE